METTGTGIVCLVIGLLMGWRASKDWYKWQLDELRELKHTADNIISDFIKENEDKKLDTLKELVK